MTMRNILKFVDHEELMRIIGPDGKTLIAYADPDRLEHHLFLYKEERESPVSISSL